MININDLKECLLRNKSGYSVKNDGRKVTVLNSDETAIFKCEDSSGFSLSTDVDVAIGFLFKDCYIFEAGYVNKKTGETSERSVVVENYECGSIREAFILATIKLDDFRCCDDIMVFIGLKPGGPWNEF